MNFLSKSRPVAAGTLAIGLSLAPAAKAATQDVWYVTSPGDSCQLSIPTTDTQVRPRASGYRNEGSSNQFVICGWGSSVQHSMVVANLVVQSMDGMAHDMTCTFTTSSDAVAPLTYVSVTQQVPASGINYYQLHGGMVGGTFGMPFSTSRLSVTCILPANVALVELQNQQRIEIGD